MHYIIFHYIMCYLFPEATTTVFESFTNSTEKHLRWSLFFSLKWWNYITAFVLYEKAVLLQKFFLIDWFHECLKNTTELLLFYGEYFYGFSKSDLWKHWKKTLFISQQKYLYLYLYIYIYISISIYLYLYIYIQFFTTFKLQNLQLQIQSCVSFQLKLEICAAPLTSFCFLCVTNAFRKQPTNWSNNSWANFCCTSSESWIFLLSIWAIPRSIK